MYTSLDNYFEAISIIRNVIEKWEDQPVKQQWDSTLPELVAAALMNVGLLQKEKKG